ncbi:ribonuclease III [Oribacterium sp. oral taxon 078 str. F0263]|uniref:ribonuclease III n=1 Tax=Oribacterium sp. oral taxon 078 TaxID=652706 RepID=UPI0001BCBDF2|nr:ribonuclease III [Oribacterium sp. oral taxon 078]EFE92072.1 ribonuclease III [Oribacterium sp. oral taxon 078 str. F0262]ERL05278.1 ribonuclease III [Oribacterium sp. oral taxon 078 str. F0263]
MDRLSLLEEKLAYSFRDRELLLHALTHPSYSNEQGDPKEASNQRLEFLGDAVLELAASDFLYHRVPVIQEGVMTKLRAALVCEPTLAEAARKLSLGDYLVLGRGEGREGIQLRDSVLSDAFEAVIGAIYLDGGFSAAQCFIKRLVLSDIENKSLYRDAKTMLQEYVSKQRLSLRYALLEESGPCHERFYRVSALIEEKEYGRGEGSSKKKAEQAAAYQALLKIKAESGYVFKIH